MDLINNMLNPLNDIGNTFDRNDNGHLPFVNTMLGQEMEDTSLSVLQNILTSNQTELMTNIMQDLTHTFQQFFDQQPLSLQNTATELFGQSNLLSEQPTSLLDATTPNLLETHTSDLLRTNMPNLLEDTSTQQRYFQSSYTLNGTKQIEIIDETIYRHNVDGTCTKIGYLEHGASRDAIYACTVKGERGKLICTVDQDGIIRHGKWPNTEMGRYTANREIKNDSDTIIGKADTKDEAAAHISLL